jgi:hypothetical protein
MKLTKTQARRARRALGLLLEDLPALSPERKAARLDYYAILAALVHAHTIDESSEDRNDG